MFTLVITSGSPVTVSEVLANVKGSDSGSPGERNEFVEVFNLSPDTVDLCGWFIYDLDPQKPDTIAAWHDSTILRKYPHVRIGMTRLAPQAFALILDRNYARPDTGQYLMPYTFPDGVLVLTTDDQAIGDGLSTKDPVIVYTKNLACTTSYGTPYNQIDSIPFDPGDGISAERMDPTLPDSINNWWSSLDSSGSTPGRINSATLAIDLSVDGQMIKVLPAVIEAGEDAEIEVTVTNCGLRPCADWSLHVFKDANLNGAEDPGEVLADHTGPTLLPGQSVAFKAACPHLPLGEHMVGAHIVCLSDIVPSNNIATRTFWVVGRVGSIGLSPSVFSPDGDGVDDLLQVDYRLPQAGGELTLSIYDANGIKQTDLVSRQTQNQDHATLFWKGTNRSGRVLPSGIYIVFMEYRTGMTTLKAKKTAVLAKRSRRG